MARYDLLSPRKKKDGGTYWHKVGAAFSRDAGGFSLSFDSLPLPDAEGKVMLLMSEPREQGEQRQERRDDGYGQRQQQRQQPASDLNDDVPW